MSNLGDVLRQVVCIPSTIPNDWSFRKLTDICSPKQWRTVSSSEMTTTGYPVFGANGFVGFFHEYNHEDETVAITCRGNTCGTINRIPPKTYITGNSMALDNIKSREVSQNYLYYALKYRGVGDSISGSAQPQITGAGLRAIEFPAPPLPEQQKIAAILSSVDDVIEKTRAQIDKLKDLKTGMMQELLTKGIGHTEFKDSPAGRIPVTWEVVQIQDVAKVIRGASPRPQGDPRYYGGSVPRLMVKDVTRDGKYVTPKIDSLTEAGAKLSRPVPAGTLTIVCSGMVGVPAFLSVDACIHDGFLAFQQITPQCDPEFLYYQLVPMQSIFDSSATHGGIFTNLTTQILKEFQVVLPPFNEQQEIAKSLSALDNHLNGTLHKLRSYEGLKKALMQDLLTGKVRVKVDQKESAVA
ncbi:type I restriction enzyme, S subunit [Marinobacter sp. es.042]|uniref:restriction endonuclease subunit S n=1 Tax=Marinobacter sp. es.042 TaxID=1761794 RepID=UPI000B4FF26D|nr:restriction endonuclease subunit S [Marinobacter sp. es.042]SNB59181.1 type I restriction enzyme, S subunit [Marinobacter sp. es.042]